jgi:hypothetical protein
MKKKEKKKEVKYYKEPSFERYKKSIESSKPQVRKELYKIQKARKDRYYKQQGQIKSGEIPSESRYRYNQVKERLSSVGSKLGQNITTGNRTYKSGNPLKGLLKSSNKTIVMVGR